MKHAPLTRVPPLHNRTLSGNILDQSLGILHGSVLEGGDIALDSEHAHLQIIGKEVSISQEESKTIFSGGGGAGGSGGVEGEVLLAAGGGGGGRGSEGGGAGGGESGVVGGPSRGMNGLEGLGMLSRKVAGVSGGMEVGEGEMGTLEPVSPDKFPDDTPGIGMEVVCAGEMGSSVACISSQEDLGDPGSLMVSSHSSVGAGGAAGDGPVLVNGLEDFPSSHYMSQFATTTTTTATSSHSMAASAAAASPGKMAGMVAGVMFEERGGAADGVVVEQSTAGPRVVAGAATGAGGGDMQLKILQLFQDARYDLRFPVQRYSSQATPTRRRGRPKKVVS